MLHLSIIEKAAEAEMTRTYSEPENGGKMRNHNEKYGKKSFVYDIKK